jgi:hypothetical protein
MDRAELTRRLRTRRSQLTEELGQYIHHIEELEASIQAIEGGDIPTPLFPPQYPYRGVPVERINTETYLLIARQIIGRQTPGQTRTPGAEKAALLQELEQCRREVRRFIASLDRELEQLEVQAAQKKGCWSYTPGAGRWLMTGITLGQNYSSTLTLLRR